jgi:hypothetical protein
MRAYGWTGLLAISTLIISTSAFGGDKGGKVADLVKDAKVEAELEKKHGKTVWEVEVFGADGSVTEVHIDAATGTVIDAEVKKGEKKKDKKGK